MNADPGRLEQYVHTLSEELGPRDAGHPGNLDRTASFIEECFDSFTNQVIRQPYRAGGMTVRNVRAILGPDTVERIVVGAHYDVAGPYPGADDNASGVAGLLELARLFSGDDLSIKVELASFPLEEPPPGRWAVMFTPRV